MSLGALFALRAVGFVIQTVSITTSPETVPYMLKFMTMWNVFFEAVYFGVCTFVDTPWAFRRLKNLFGGKNLDHHPAPPKSTAFHLFFRSIIYPFSIGIGVLFWAVHSYDNKLVFAVGRDRLVGPVRNQLNHTFPLIACLLEICLVNHNYPLSPVKDLIGGFTFWATYFSYLSYLIVARGDWVYTILNVLAFHNRILFIGLSYLCLVTSYFSGRAINSLLYSAEKPSKAKAA